MWQDDDDGDGDEDDDDDDDDDDEDDDGDCCVMGLCQVAPLQQGGKCYVNTGEERVWGSLLSPHSGYSGRWAVK